MPGAAGSHTVLDLLKNNYRVTIIDNFDNAFDECWKRMQKLAGGKADKMKLIRVRHLAACRRPPPPGCSTAPPPLLCCPLPHCSP